MSHLAGPALVALDYNQQSDQASRALTSHTYRAQTCLAVAGSAGTFHIEVFARRTPQECGYFERAVGGL
jgi:hypothetical protein